MFRLTIILFIAALIAGILVFFALAATAGYIARRLQAGKEFEDFY